MSEAIRYINENTSLQFKVVVPILVAVVSGTLWIQRTLAEIKSAQAEAVSRAELREWRNHLADRNPSLQVPYLREERKP